MCNAFIEVFAARYQNDPFLENRKMRKFKEHSRGEQITSQLVPRILSDNGSMWQG